MKVLLLNGSPRRESNTLLALQEIAKTLAKEGIESEILSLGTQQVRSCIVCNTCKRKADNCCVFDDDLCNRLTEKMQGCDALVVGTPVYYGQPNGAVISLVQRALYSAGSYFSAKPVAGVAVCRRGGATAALQTLMMPFQLLHMPIVTSQYWNIVYGQASGEAALDKEGMQTMRSLAENMAFLLRATEKQPRPEYEARQAMNFIR